MQQIILLIEQNSSLTTIVNYTDKLRYHLPGNVSRLDVRLLGHVGNADVDAATEVAFRSEHERGPLIPRSGPAGASPARKPRGNTSDGIQQQGHGLLRS